MTNPIRPEGPGTNLPTPSTSETGATSKTSFSEVLKASKTGSAQEAQQIQSLSGPNAEIAADLKTGKIDAQQAVNALIEQALNGPEAASLDASSKQQLAEILRTAFEQDPNLSSLLKTSDGGDSNE